MIFFGLIIFEAVVCIGADANGELASKTAQTTLTLDLQPLLTFSYAPDPINNNQLILARVGNTRRFSTNPDNDYDGYGAMSISSQLNSWQLDASMANMGKLVQSNGASTENPLVINLYTTGYENDPIPRATAVWPPVGLATCTMITMNPNIPGSSYVYYPKYDITTTINDHGGYYSGVVTWTVSPVLQDMLD